jgi:8-oxo-dGTP pyrophosphatase MutT (NUDIX family)
MTPLVQKVTAFITRSTGAVTQLLLFRHPYAGIQLPAGTVEPGEVPEEAVLREAEEETGLDGLTLRQLLGREEINLPQPHYLVADRTPVYARPSGSSFNWAALSRGIAVRVERRVGKWCQVTYLEYDKVPEPDYVTYQITGWVPEGVLAPGSCRFFYHLLCSQATPERWSVETDGHRFILFWAPVDALPDLVPLQQRWLAYLPLP